MASDKISKVELNGQQYSLRGDANNIKDVMLPTINDLYSKINTGIDSETLDQILESLNDIQSSKADKEELNDIWSQINNLSSQMPNGVISYYTAYKISSQTPERPGNNEQYVPQGWNSQPITPNLNEALYMTIARVNNGTQLTW